MKTEQVGPSQKNPKNQ